MFKNNTYYIDTCILKDLLNFKDKNKTIKNKYFKEKLIKHITVFGCSINMFNLAEILKDKDFLSDNVQLNFRQFNCNLFLQNKACSIFTNEFKKEMCDIKKLEMFKKFINNFFSEKIAGYLADLILFPFLLMIRLIFELYKKVHIYIQTNKIKHLLSKIKKIITNKLCSVLRNIDVLNKTQMGKGFFNFYKNFSFAFSYWFNNYSKIIVENKSNNSFIVFLNSFIEIISKYDFKKIKKDLNCFNVETSQATGKNNLILNYLGVFQEVGADSIEPNFENKLIGYLKDTGFKSYKWDSTPVLDYYFKKHIEELYFKPIDLRDSIENNLSKHLNKIFDSNDLIDMMSLNSIIENGSILLSTDKEINNCLKAVCVSNDIDIINRFIKS